MTTDRIVEASEEHTTERSIFVETDEKLAFLDAAQNILRKGMAIAGVTLAAGVAVPAANAEYTPKAQAETQQKTIGTRAVAAIIVNFENEKPGVFTRDQVGSDLFTAPDSVSSIFKRQSFGKFSLGGIYNPNGDVYGPVTVKNTMKELCEQEDGKGINQVTKAAYNAVEAQTGQSLAEYDDYLYFTPYQSHCTFGGISIGNTALVNTSNPKYTKQVSLHELGHNIGLGHAKKLYCSAKNGEPRIDTGICVKAEYEDYLDPMGGARSNPLHQEFNGYNKARLGWGKTKTIKKDAVVEIAPIDSSSEIIHSARVAIGGTKEYPEYLYLDYKILPNHSVDETNTTPISGVTIRRATALDHTKNKTSYAPTLLYDMNPHTASAYDAALAAGKTFRAKSGVTIKTLSTNETRARVRISNVDPSPFIDLSYLH